MRETSKSPEIPADYLSCEYETIVRQTDLALLVDFGDKTEWIPKKIAILSNEKGVKKISLPDWLYKQKKL